MIDYYPIAYKKDGVTRYVIELYDGEDDKLATQNSKLIAFSSQKEVIDELKRHNIEPSDEEINLINFDELHSLLLARPGKATKDFCSAMYDFWNLGIDAYKALDFSEEDLLSKNNMDLFNRLFSGINLPSINTSGKIYEPDLSDDDLNELNRIYELIVSVISDYTIPAVS